MVQLMQKYAHNLGHPFGGLVSILVRIKTAAILAAMRQRNACLIYNI